MKKSELLALLILFFIGSALYGQNPNNKFKMEGINPKSIEINQSFSKSAEIFPFDKNAGSIYGLDITANISLQGDQSLVRLVLIDSKFDEYLIYENYNLLAEEEISFSVENICEETGILEQVKPYAINIEIENATLELKSISYATAIPPGLSMTNLKKENKKAQNEVKIKKINQNLKKKGKHWVAGETSVSELSYGERKKLYGQSTFPDGFEYYVGGVITAGSTESTSTDDGSLKSANVETTSPYVDDWDWRNRHGKNWITSVKNQGTCGSCWAFSSIGATEAMVNLYFNQQLNLDLSEQDLISCSIAGDCIGGVPGNALDYIASNGVVDEATFPYSESDGSCMNKGTNPLELIKIGGKSEYGSLEYPRTEDILKKMLIHMGPLSGGLRDWSHAMTLVGYKVVKEGDVFYYRDLDLWRSWKTVIAGDPLIGKTVWIFKNSWGDFFGDEGYVYVETPLTNIIQTFAIETPVSSIKTNRQVVCEDADGDGYYWWGLGSKPEACNGPDQPDGDDSNRNLGPIDQYGYCMEIGIPPLANFTSNNTTITNDETVTFTDLSSNALTRVWTFEGGTPSSSTLENPIVSFPNVGIYDVTLTVTSPDGSNTKTVSNYINVQKKTYCESYGNATNDWIASIQINDQIQTSGSSSSIGYDNLTSFSFNTTAGTTQNFTFIPGFTDVPQYWFWRIWIDFNEDGDFDDAGETVIPLSYGKSVISGSFNIPPNLNIITRMRVSMKRNGDPLPCAQFSYGEVEDYTISISSDGLVQPPVTEFTGSSTSIEAGQRVTFTDQSTYSPTSWSWTFEGGTPATSTVQNPTVTYNTPGTYNVTLITTNANGFDSETKIDYITVNVLLTPPVADFTCSATSIEEKQTVTFTDQSTNLPTSWSWTFEGGTPATSTAQNPMVTYNSPGTYNVTITVTNADGSDSETKVDYITVNALPTPPVAEFSADNSTVFIGGKVNFSDLSTNNPDEWAWQFPGGTPSTSTEQNPGITYNTTGTYDVSLTVSNPDGTDTKTMIGYIDVTVQTVNTYPPVASFTYSSSSINEGESITFSDQSTNTPTSWSWTFNGGTPDRSTEKDPTVTYAAAGTYSVSLTVTNDDGTDTKSSNNIITVNKLVIAPAADFEADNTIITEGETVSFTDLSSNEPTSWSWTFEGGTPGTSTAQNPSVTYTTAGTYQVTLVATNAKGSDTKIAYNYIQVDEYVASYCIPSSVNASSEWIASVKIDGQSNTSGSIGYADLTSFGFNLESGANHNIVLTPGFDPRSKFEFWAVWIDINGDMVFSDSEKLFDSSKSKSSVFGSIYIPTGLNITTRMRVAMSPVAPTTCDVLIGEVEDYTVRIFEPAPLADFTASSTNVMIGESVQFTNTSLYNPTSLFWDFNGTNPASSNDPNPVISYESPGDYIVTLTASNELGSSQKSMTISVMDGSTPTPLYCTPSNISSDINYINNVAFAGLNVSSGADGYQLSTTAFDNLNVGKVYPIELSPWLSTTRNYWRIWIDFDQDGLFDDANESVLELSNKKGMVSGNILIPSNARGSTRMRIAMKVGSAPTSCEDSFDGEIEDYEVSFEGVPATSSMASSANPLADIQENNIIVYPNPTENMVNLKVALIGKTDSYAVYNSTGVKIMENNITAPLSLIDLSVQPPGMYLIVVNSQSHNYIEKVIKN